MSEIKPCPFCGQEEIVFSTNSTEYGILFSATCESCGAMAGGTNNRKHQKEIALESWNTRPIEDALTAENEALKARVAEMEKHLPSEYLQTQTGLPRYVTKLEADNARMREALEELISECKDGDFFLCVKYIRELVGKALEGGE